MKDNIYKITLNNVDIYEPLLKKYYGYTEDLFYLDIVETYNREVLDPRIIKIAEEVKLKGLKNYLKQKNEREQLDEEEMIMNTVLRNKNLHLHLNFKEFSFEKLVTECVLPEFENKALIYSILFTVTYLVIRENDPASGRSESTLDAINDNLISYSQYGRNDLLKLFLFQDGITDKFKNKKDQIPPITIKCGNDKVEISNKNNWFIRHLYLYLYDYLGVENVKEAMAELETYKKKQGRTSPLINRIIWGTYNLLKDNFADYNKRKVPDKMCTFILDFLFFMKLIDEKHILFDNVIQVRAIINYLIKSNYNPYPWESELLPSPKLPDKLKNSTYYW